MKKRALLVTCGVVFALSLVFVAGCNDPAAGRGGDPKEPLANLIEDGAPKYYKHQAWCTVCNGRPLYEKHYVDVDGKRIYFDSAECAKKFKENQSKYLPTFKEQIEKARKHEGLWYPNMG